MASAWFTTLQAIRAAEPEWQAIACYREPIAAFLRRVYPGLPADLREDVVQEVLCAMRTSVVRRFDPERGRFRDFLRGVIRNQVRKVSAREARGTPGELDPERVAAATPEELGELDLAARLVRAVRELHDELLKAGEDERQVLYCLADRLLDGLSYGEIAAKEGLSTDQVKRRLQTARRGVLLALLRGALEDAGVAGAGAEAERLGEAFGEALRSRRPAEAFGERPAERVALALVEAVHQGVRRFPGLDSPDGEGFVSALRGVLDEEGGMQ
ncbi:MAG: sigma-70 family RNA polymerase sigma factor [Planctomycetota bacterium]